MRNFTIGPTSGCISTLNHAVLSCQSTQSFQDCTYFLSSYYLECNFGEFGVVNDNFIDQVISVSFAGLLTTKFDFPHYSYKYCFKCLPSSFRFLKNVSFTRIFAPVACIFRQICLVNSATEWNVLKEINSRRSLFVANHLLQVDYYVSIVIWKVIHRLKCIMYMWTLFVSKD